MSRPFLSIENLRCVCHSFFSIFVGWLVAYAAFIAQALLNDGQLSDVAFWFDWPLILTFLGWVFVGIPLVLMFPARYVRSLKLMIIWHVAAATISFLVVTSLLSLAFSASDGFLSIYLFLLYLVWWPMAIGLVAGALFWGLQRSRYRLTWIVVILPVVFFPFCRFVALPAAVSLAPYQTYVTAGKIKTSDARAMKFKALLAIVDGVEVGDSLDSLESRYPGVFSTNTNLYGLLHVEDNVFTFNDWQGNRKRALVFDRKKEKVVRIETF